MYCQVYASKSTFGYCETFAAYFKARLNYSYFVEHYFLCCYTLIWLATCDMDNGTVQVAVCFVAPRMTQNTYQVCMYDITQNL